MSRPQIEEVSDSDPEIEDPSDFLPGEVFRPANTSSRPSQPASSSTQPNPTLYRPQVPSHEPSEAEIAEKRKELKPYTTLYPIYFSSQRTRSSGRRVSSKLAVQDPLAFNVLKAVRHVLGNNIRVAFEPDKTHPKDWANPGRVKVQLFDSETKEPLHPTVQNKQHLYNLVAQYLKDHPTKPEDPLELRIQGLQVPEKFLESKVAVPRGWKMSGVLPVHSAAVSGGGVSDNFLKEAMEEMRAAQAQGQLPGMGGAGGGAGPGGMDMGAMAQMMQNMGIGGSGAGTGGSGGKKKDKKKG
ncbi:signal recognition particle subunit [Neophaeococcomyces mojaviensis]|uniref:Signal recognition particle subunit n=1 Tax=Neophaeococcomyces mojaviensis TaxID=3383035 RepID=A0ACC2ZZA6_9EURO|nr:signal recognition particle subunit [Knufia sp. JES_112]